MHYDLTLVPNKLVIGPVPDEPGAVVLHYFTQLDGEPYLSFQLDRPQLAQLHQEIEAFLHLTPAVDFHHH